ncbi:sodium-dependent transporter [Prevotella sp. PCHR]|uniref:Transporter n=1 Tax=Xylanibacter caecicola TaxID=2736294 RepID=A0ABX2B4E4_9BACT|nr:sodium-dependent transporter [Xylanibacter caecicola]NPE26276.1 sodium-dependent transporter [Xylanibacter caecicola]
MSRSERINFGSRLGVVLATAGSAVGLGNVWRFPFMTGHNGGAAFILIYLGCILLLGIPGMISEFIVGRHSAANAARSYRRLANGTPWMIIGYMGVFTSMLILGFYAVVAGWCLQYLFASVAEHLQGDAAYVSKYFADFSSDPVKPTLWAVTFVLITHVIVSRGIRDGIEKVSKLLMPLLFILLMLIVVASCMLPGAYKGVEFLFKPDFSKLDTGVFLEALGQAFFSLSLGTACLCTYASYFGRKTNLAGAAVQIALIDTLIAILAGLMIFPAAFSVGVHPDSGPSLIFITLPNVFRQAFLGVPFIGYVVSVLFYALMSLAALTSTISMHEIGTAFFHEELKLSRRGGAAIVTVLCCIMTVLCSLSFGACPELAVAGKSLMDCFDNVTAQVLMPLAAFLTCLFVGWYIPRTVVADELSSYGAVNAWYTGLYLYSVKIICPLGILAIFLHQFGLI